VPMGDERQNQELRRRQESPVMQADKSGDQAMYGRDVNRREILNGTVAAPASAKLLLDEIGGYARVAKAE